MKKILLPTDFSDNARNAIDYALYLFEKEECIFHVMNSYQAGPSGLSSTRSKAHGTRLYRAIKDEAERRVKNLLKDLRDKNQNSLHTFEGLSVSDSLLNAVGRITIDKDVDYIFMGTKGSSAIKEIFMGSNTVKVIQNIDFCPIIAVPGDYIFDLPDKIAFATNFEHMYSKIELIPFIDLAKLWNSEITIVHVDMEEKGLTKQQKRSKNVLIDRLYGLSHSFEEIKGERKISDAIKSYVSNEKEVGMVAMIGYWHSFFEKLTKENVIKRVAFNTEVPFMVFPLIDP
jgi:nucleotide-binding universal stress UspA family protein